MSTTTGYQAESEVVRPLSITMSIAVRPSTREPVWSCPNLPESWPSQVNVSEEAMQGLMRRRVLLALATSNVVNLKTEDGTLGSIFTFPERGYSAPKPSIEKTVSHRRSSLLGTAKQPTEDPMCAMAVRKNLKELTQSGRPQSTTLYITVNKEGMYTLTETGIRLSEGTARLGAFLKMESDKTATYHAIPYPLPRKFLTKYNCSVTPASPQSCAKLLETFHLGTLNSEPNPMMSDLMDEWWEQHPVRKKRSNFGLPSTSATSPYQSSVHSGPIQTADFRFAQSVDSLYQKLDDTGLLDEIFKHMSEEGRTKLDTAMLNPFVSNEEAQTDAVGELSPTSRSETAMSHAPPDNSIPNSRPSAEMAAAEALTQLATSRQL